MSIEFQSTAQITGSGTSHTASVTSTGNSRMIIAAFRGGGAEGDRVSSVTYGGDALTRIGTVTEPGDSIVVQLWYLLQPTTGSNTLTVTLSTSGFITGYAALYTGVQQRQQPDASGTKTQSNNATVAVPITPTRKNTVQITSVSDRVTTTAVSSTCVKRGNTLFDTVGIDLTKDSLYNSIIGGGDSGTDWGAVTATFIPAQSSSMFMVF